MKLIIRRDLAKLLNESRMNGSNPKYLTVQAMRKMRPGARFGMAVAIAGDVSLMPFRNRVWNIVTLQIIQIWKSQY